MYTTPIMRERGAMNIDVADGRSSPKSAPRPVHNFKLCQRVWTSFTAIALFALLVTTGMLPSAGLPHGDAGLVLRNKHGVEVHILRTGAAIHRLLLPDHTPHLVPRLVGG